MSDWVKISLLVIGFILATIFLPATQTAGIYTVLSLTMWIVGAKYLQSSYQRIRSGDTSDVGMLLLSSGIALAMTGHAIDQTQWAVANTLSALDITTGAVGWIVVHLWWLVNIGKGMAVLGGLFHLRVMKLRSRGYSIPNLAAVALVSWCLISLLYAYVPTLYATQSLQ